MPKNPIDEKSTFVPAMAWFHQATSLYINQCWPRFLYNVTKLQSVKWKLCISDALIHNHDDVMKWKHFPRYWPFVWESSGHRWILLAKARDGELWCFLWSAHEQTFEQTIETLVIWDAVALIMTSLHVYRPALHQRKRVSVWCLVGEWGIEMTLTELHSFIADPGRSELQFDHRDLVT